MPAAFGSDLRLTFRYLRTHAGYGLAAMVTLALGVGATTAMFSAVYLDVPTYGAVVAVIAVVVIVATYLPVRRATRVAPAEVLREV